MLLIFSTW